MKKSSVFKKSIIALLPISLGLGVVLGVAKNHPVESKGYSAASLPTTIDLNDTSASTIRSYYSSLNSLGQSERQGTNLLKNLKTILKNGQKYFSYESGTDVWRMYEITDRDWDKSPASSTTYGTYNASTNKITNYSYGSSASSSKNNPYIHALYINRDIDNKTTAWDNHNQDEWGINREHVWPKAEGFDSSGAGGARGDPMHLMAGNGYSNNIHSNYYYGYVKTSTSYTDCGSKYSNQSGNLRGTSKTLNSGTVFEPQDCDKGDIARAIFYMVARYNYLSGSDSDGIDTNNPNLTLTQDISDWSSSGYTSSTSRQGKLGVLTDLLAWHHADPVDEYEIHRNNLLYTNFTNNRNPFIDFPEWVDFIWGTATYNGSTYQGYSSTPTGYATPSSDTINGYNGGGSTDPVAVTGVSLNKESTTLLVGESEVLTANVAPSNATNQAVSWTSSNTSVATISSSGRVSAVSEGNSTITVTTSDGGFTATCSVSVTTSGGGGGGEGGEAAEDTMCAVGFGGYTTSSYSAAGTDYTGKANLTNATNCTYAMQVFNGSTGQVRGNQSTANANFSCRNTTTYDGYYVSEVSLTVDSGGTLDGSTADRSVVWFGSSAYANPTTAPSTGASVNATPAQSGQQTLTWTNSNTAYNYFMLYNLKAASAPKCKDADTPLKVTWSPISASTKVLESISLDTSDVNKSFYMNDEFDYSGLSVTANYDVGDPELVTNYTVTAPDMTTAGQKTVNVSYSEGGVTKSASYQITVSSTNLSSIEISSPKTTYYVGESFEKPTVTATYSNGHTSEVTESSTFTGYNLSTTGNQTVTVSYSFNGTTKTLTYQITVKEIPAQSGTADNPYTVEEARAAITAAGSSTLSSKYTQGIICKIDYYDSTYHSITYWISDDGTTSVMLEVYSGKGIGGANFSSTSDLSVGDIVVVVGELKKYNDIFEYNYNNQLVSRIPAVATNAYSRITNPSELLTGDEIIFAYSKTSANYTMSELDNNVMATTTISKSDSVMTKNANTMSFTIVKTSEGYRFKNSSNEYLAWSSGSYNYATLETESNLSVKSLFNITYSNSQMSIVGANNDGYSSPRNSLKFYSRNNSNYFSFFTSNTTSQYVFSPSIYKKLTQVYADTWADDFLKSTKNCVVSGWSELEDSYNELAPTVKQEIIDCVANEDLNYSLRSQAMARYEYILGDSRFNSGLSNFVTGRVVLASNGNIVNNYKYGSSDSMVVIIIITTVSMSSVAMLLIIKARRKRLN